MEKLNRNFWMNLNPTEKIIALLIFHPVGLFHCKCDQKLLFWSFSQYSEDIFTFYKYSCKNWWEILKATPLLAVLVQDVHIKMFIKIWWQHVSNYSCDFKGSFNLKRLIQKLAEVYRAVWFIFLWLPCIHLQLWSDSSRDSRRN